MSVVLSCLYTLSIVFSVFFFFFSSRRRHTRFDCDWSSDVCSSDLLPDGTVWVVGGNPQRGTYEQHMEIYSPAYLFNADGSLATRPTIAGVPGAISYGGAFEVQTPDAATITSVVLMRPGAPTHAFDMDQRLGKLSHSVGSGALNVAAPPNCSIAPPGDFMLL